MSCSLPLCGDRSQPLIGRSRGGIIEGLGVIDTTWIGAEVFHKPSGQCGTITGVYPPTSVYGALDGDDTINVDSEDSIQ